MTLNKDGSERKVGTRKLAKHHERVVALAAKGLYIAEIARELGVTNRCVQSYLGENGLSVDRVARRVAKETEKLKEKERRLEALPLYVRLYGSERNQQIVSHYLENHTLEETGQKFSLSRERVRQILNKCGVKPRTGTTQIVRPFRPRRSGLTTKEKFWSLVEATADPRDCWEWKRPLGKHPYGRMRLRGVLYGSHVLAYYFTHGRFPTKWALHRCDNPSCCNPAHIYDGTPADNVRDRDERGRSAYLRDNEGFRAKIREGRARLKELQNISEPSFLA
jgi:hypothetical protein